MSLTFVISCLCLFYIPGSFCIETSKTEAISAMEGDSVTLDSDVTELQRDDVIVWTFGPLNTHIAKINRVHNETFHTGRFRDRLMLDYQTGSLTITNISTEHAGLYKTEIVIGNTVSNKDFIVKVYARLPVPVITRYCPQSPPSSESSCSVVCLVVNVSAVSLSWYKGNSLLSSISVSDLKSSVLLYLEVEYQDKDTYSCAINNPISNHTTRLDIGQLCDMHSAPFSVNVHYYGLTEAVIRLALSAVVGVATIVLLVYEVRS